MKAYWLIGCMLLGMVLADAKTKCPRDEINAAEIVAQVAAWPVYVVAALFYRGRLIETECKVLK